MMSYNKYGELNDDVTSKGFTQKNNSLYFLNIQNPSCKDQK